MGTLPRVELHIRPPLSYKMDPSKTGGLLLEERFVEGDTLGGLLLRLLQREPSGWPDIFDIHRRTIRPAVVTIINGALVSSREAPKRSLSGSDRIEFYLMYSGG